MDRPGIESKTFIIKLNKDYFLYNSRWVEVTLDFGEDTDLEWKDEYKEILGELIDGKVTFRVREEEYPDFEILINKYLK